MSTASVSTQVTVQVSSLRRGIIETLKWVSVVIFAVLVLVVLWQVFARQVLSQPSTWSTTVAQYMLVWLTLFSMAFVFAERGHVAVDIVSRLAPPAVQKILAILVELAVALFAGLGLVWGGIRGVALTWGQSIPGLSLTIGHMYLALPVCGAIVFVVAILDLIDAARFGVLPSLEPPASDVVPAPAIPRQSADAGPHSRHRESGEKTDSTEV